MRILITGADGPLAAVAAAALRGQHDLRLIGSAEKLPDQVETRGLDYRSVDLREPEQVAVALAGIEAVAHLAPHIPFSTPDAEAEKLALDTAARGAFVLCREALKAGVKRIVLA